MTARTAVTMVWGMDAATRELLDRISGLIPRGRIREIAMFGAVAVMLDDAMLVAVNRNLSLLVRVAREEDDQLLREADAARAVMGTGREMGAGWLRVAPGPDPARLDFWLRAALRRPR